MRTQHGAYQLVRRIIGTGIVLTGLISSIGTVNAAALSQAPITKIADADCTFVQAATSFGYADGGKLIKRDILAKLENAYRRNKNGASDNPYPVVEYVRDCYAGRGLMYLSEAVNTLGTRWYNMELSAELLNEAASTYPPALTLLGLYRMLGRNGQAKAPSASLHILSLAAKKGEAAAMVWLGLLYESGQVTGKNKTDAFKLFRKAAKYGYAPGGTGMARVILSEGVSGSVAEAWGRLEWASDRGDPEAQYLLARLLSLEENADKRTRGVELMNQAADACFEPAIVALSQPETSDGSPSASVDSGKARISRTCRSPFWEWIMK